MARPFLAGMLAAAGAWTAYAEPARQQVPPPQQQPPVFRAGTRTVTVPVVVTDEVGQAVRDLKQEDFEIRDNGQVQPVTFFDRDLQPITAILLLDGSASMISVLDEQIAAATEFVLRLLPGDRLRLGSFAEQLRMMPEYTGDRDELLGFLENEFNIRLGRRTRLWDAMDEALVALGRTDGRRVLIVLSDGIDTFSLQTYDTVRRRAGRSDVAITFARVLQRDRTGLQLELQRGRDGSSEGRMRPLPAGGFAALAAETGGVLVNLDPAQQMDAPFTQIALDLHGQYILGFSPAALDGKVHRLDVRVKQRGLEVRARRSYLAAEEGK
jgi:VWFA-related protein